MRVFCRVKKGRLRNAVHLAGILAFSASAACVARRVIFVANDPGVDPLQYISTPVLHRGGLFSQLFVILKSALNDLEVHHNTSSKNWKIRGWNPKAGSRWSDGIFEDVFMPTRLVAESVAPNETYFMKVRKIAKASEGNCP